MFPVTTKLFEREIMFLRFFVRIHYDDILVILEVAGGWVGATSTYIFLFIRSSLVQPLPYQQSRQKAQHSMHNSSDIKCQVCWPQTICNKLSESVHSQVTPPPSSVCIGLQLMINTLHLHSAQILVLFIHYTCNPCVTNLNAALWTQVVHIRHYLYWVSLLIVITSSFYSLKF